MTIFFIIIYALVGLGAGIGLWADENKIRGLPFGTYTLDQVFFGIPLFLVFGAPLLFCGFLYILFEKVSFKWLFKPRYMFKKPEPPEDRFPG